MSMIPHPLVATSLARPEHPVLLTPEGAISARELVRRVERCAAALRSHGVMPGMRVAIRGMPSVDFVTTLHAIGWLGAAVFPLPWRIPEDELRVLLAAADKRVGDLPDAIPLGVEDPSPCPAREWALDDVRLIVATSGTTGRPRPVPLTTLQLLFSAFGSAIRIGHLPEDRWICALPLNHVGGLSIIFRCAWYGTTVDLHPKFNADRVNQSIEEGATLLSAVPVMLERILDVRNGRPFPPNLRCVLLGGAKAPDSLIERCREIRAPVSLTWGMTEAASQIATRFPGDLDGVGAPPLPFASVRVDGGRLSVTGPIAAKGGFSTSDRGFIDDRGQIHVTGRADDVIISGGENIDPAEIEQVLAQHPAVKEVVVAGVPDETWGARPVAFLVGRAVADEELRAWCRASLQRFKVPARFNWVEQLPRNRLGKVVRRALVESPAS